MTNLTVRRADHNRQAEPFAELERWFGESFPGWFGHTVPGLPIDIVESDDAYLVEVDAPGVRKEDLELTLERNRLTIGVNAAADETEGDRRYLRRERVRMHASRTIRFPMAIDPEGITAAFDSGVLRITAPKAASDKARRIEIA